MHLPSDANDSKVDQAGMDREFDVETREGRGGGGGGGGRTWYKVKSLFSTMGCSTSTTTGETPRMNLRAHFFSAPEMIFGNGTTVGQILTSVGPCSASIFSVRSLLPCRGNGGLAQLLNPQLIEESPYTDLRLHFTRNVVKISVTLVTARNVEFLSFIRSQYSATRPSSLVPCIEFPKASSRLIIRTRTGEPNIGVSLLSRDAGNHSSTAQDAWSHWDNLNKSDVSMEEGLRVSRIIRDSRKKTFSVTSTMHIGMRQGQGPFLISVFEVLPPPNEAAFEILLNSYRFITNSSSGHVMEIKNRCDLDHNHKCVVRFLGKGSESESHVLNFDVLVSYGDVIFIYYECRKSYRHRELFSFDANAGSIYFPEMIRIEDFARENTPFMVLSGSNLFTSHSPDFSMPFNVITLVSTVAALLLGSMVNVLVKKRRKGKKRVHL